MSNLTERLDEALAVCDAATDGPWYSETAILENSHTAVYYTFHNGDTMDRDLIADVASSPARDGREPDAEFIAHARTGYPAALRALQAVLDLHHRIPSGNEPPWSDWHCAECIKDAETEGTIAWPCPTTLAIIKHLGSTAKEDQ